MRDYGGKQSSALLPNAVRVDMVTVNMSLYVQLRAAGSADMDSRLLAGYKEIIEFMMILIALTTMTSHTFPVCNT